MAFNRPKITEIMSRIEADIDSRLDGSDPKLRAALLNAVMNGVAAVSHGLHGHLDWLSLQIIPDTADSEILERHASWWGITRNKATSAIGLIDFVGTDGAVIGTDILWVRSDGVEFEIDQEVTIVAGVASVSVTAVIAGSDGNTAAGSKLTPITPLAGINSEAIVDASGLTGGTEIESLDSLGDRLQERVQQTPQGGAKVDYIKWAKEVPGVTRVWPFGLWMGDGTVGVFFTRDDDVTLIPDAGEVTTVQDYIDSVRPVTADVIVMAPTEAAQAMTIQLSPNTTAVQAAIEDSLNDLFRVEAQVEDGTGSGTVLISHVREAISIATGENNHILVSPSTDITLSAGELSTLGAITWQAIP
ncbi:MAG: baseplate J/gp47 family protein [Cycloclasticus sp.]